MCACNGAQKYLNEIATRMQLIIHNRNFGSDSFTHERTRSPFLIYKDNRMLRLCETVSTGHGNHVYIL